MTQHTAISGPHPVRPISRKGFALFFGFLAFQFVCAFPFMFDLWGEVLGLRTSALPWYMAEITQVLASAGLVVGIVAAGLYGLSLLRSQRRILQLDRQIGAVSGEFQAQLETQFNRWTLSRSEAEIAIYAMKGFSNAEIGDFRGTSTATVKSQMNAIYRKSGFANRQQLISFLVEEMLASVDPASKVASNALASA